MNENGVRLYLFPGTAMEAIADGEIRAPLHGVRAIGSFQGSRIVTNNQIFPKGFNTSRVWNIHTGLSAQTWEQHAISGNQVIQTKAN